MIVRKLDTSSQRDIKKFIGFPYLLYRDCPQWVPPLNSELRLVMNRQKHPYYQHSTADFLVVESEGDVLARVAILHNRNYSTHHKKATSFFYYYESVNDPAASDLLFKAAIAWAREQQTELIIGPRGFSRSSGIGLLTEGFEYLPAMGIPYNLPYYEELIRRAGFEKETDYFSGYLKYSQQLDNRIHLAAEKVKARGEYWVKTFSTRAEMIRMIDYVNSVHHEAFQNNPGYYPSTDAEFRLMAQSIIQIADPRLIKLIMKGDEVAGFVIAYPDVSCALQRIKGELYPFGWVDVLLEKQRTHVVDLNGVGLLPKHQGMGANVLLYTELEKSLRMFNFDHAELVQVDERNFKSKSDMENVGVHWYKNHRLFRLPLVGTSP